MVEMYKNNNQNKLNIFYAKRKFDKARNQSAVNKTHMHRKQAPSQQARTTKPRKHTDGSFVSMLAQAACGSTQG